MEHIFDPNDQFDFHKLVLTKPVSIPGGNFFIRFLVNNSHVYIQPPKCKTKQGIIKAGKRIYSDLMFTHEDDQFIRWMENLETHCQTYILKNKAEWFEGDLELHDIENYFTSPLKVYKSGTCYTVRTNISTVLGKPTLKIYDEQENEVDMDAITDKTNIMSILEIQGIKCSARSFQIEIELKQMLTLMPINIFDKCLLIKKPALTLATATATVAEAERSESGLNEQVNSSSSTEPFESVDSLDSLESGQPIVSSVNEEVGLAEEETTENITIDTSIPSIYVDLPQAKDPNILEEVEFDLAELPEEDSIQIKKRNDVYYEMYREARRKAKIARDLALSSYLEVKRIKNTYMLDDIKDSDDSDLENEEESLQFEP
jgi:hypothetical protein